MTKEELIEALQKLDCPEDTEVFLLDLDVSIVEVNYYPESKAILLE